MNECDITSLIFDGNGLKIETTKLYDKISIQEAFYYGKTCICDESESRQNE